MGRVIRADRAGPAVIAAEVADATAQARAILERARAQAEQIAAAARVEGRAEGRAELAAGLLAQAQERERALQALEPQAVELALLAARRIVGQELSVRPAAVAEMVVPLLRRLRRARQVTLRVHPDDGAALEPCLRALCAQAELAAGVQLEHDPTLERGDCVVQSELGSLDARIETQLQALARALRAT